MLGPLDLLAPPPRRVLIAGPSGVGKTALAQRVEVAACLPHTEIDALFHGPGWTALPDFIENVDEFTSAPRWVTEWQYTTQLGGLLPSRADTLVWLDLPVAVHMTRLVSRTIRRRLKRTELWNGNFEGPIRGVFRDPEHIIRWGWSGRAKSRDRVAALEREHPHLRVIRLRSQREVEEWVRSLGP